MPKITIQLDCKSTEVGRVDRKCIKSTEPTWGTLVDRVDRRWHKSTVTARLGRLRGIDDDDDDDE